MSISVLWFGSRSSSLVQEHKFWELKISMKTGTCLHYFIHYIYTYSMCYQYNYLSDFLSVKYVDTHIQNNDHSHDTFMITNRSECSLNTSTLQKPLSTKKYNKARIKVHQTFPAAVHEHILSAQVHIKHVSQVKESYNYQAFIDTHP